MRYARTSGLGCHWYLSCDYCGLQIPRMVCLRLCAKLFWSSGRACDVQCLARAAHAAHAACSWCAMHGARVIVVCGIWRSAARATVTWRSCDLGLPAVVFAYVKGAPMYGLKTESSFDAAHFLTDYHGKCENLHGHRWRVVAYLEQEELQTQGTHKDMVIDFADFKGALRDLTEGFDHSFVVEEGSLAPDTLACLEREGFSLSIVPFRTTAENLARYFYGKLADAGFPVSQVDVYETPNNCAIYRG
ncbi:6-carboxytetrahydropterin synthase [uncultured Ellagibacter sp.]|uniref:6-pyruvoyl trahydropterin synthase family protein n=1 Tax=uncultured Ellagibacter sp. TaxID=2137580 RepID=UPI00261D5D42|nr:6-carboxytetrahydropterin synthase [uncultured Ellagibacter sp.]